jgi:hypothetical protein
VQHDGVLAEGRAPALPDIGGPAEGLQLKTVRRPAGRQESARGEREEDVHRKGAREEGVEEAPRSAEAQLLRRLGNG